MTPTPPAHPEKPGIVAPAVRDLAELSGRLAGWLRPRLGTDAAVAVDNLAYPLGAGMSHETILFDAAWRQDGVPRRAGMVVRIKPVQQTVYLDDMFDEQYRLMQLMHAHGAVRVARPLWIEPSSDLLGAPFFVMEKVAGRVAVSYPPYAKQGWLFEAAPSDRRRMWEDAVRQLAAIQTVPVEAAGFLASAGDAPAGFDQEVDRWRRFLDWVDPQSRLTLLREGLHRLLATGPTNRPEGIVWGDARLGNMMIGPDFKVAAVMDWEQPSLGGALHDLGWWLRSDHNQTAGRGLPCLEGMGTREETIALWQEVCGKSAADIDWYETFVVFKQECLAVRMSLTGALPPTGVAPGVGLARQMGYAPTPEEAPHPDT